MSLTISNVITLLRYIINDTAQSGSDMFTYSNSSVFTLTEANVLSVTDVAVNDITSSVSYSYNSTLNKVTVSSSLTTSDNVEISYTYYNSYSDTELTNYIYNALAHLSINKYYDFQILNSTVYPEPTESEKNLIAIIASVLINPQNQSYRTPDLTVTVADKIPTFDRIKRIIAAYKKSPMGLITIL